MGLLRVIAWIPAAALVGVVGLGVGIGIGARNPARFSASLDQLGWKPSGSDKPAVQAGSATDPSSAKIEKQLYHCAMHPQVIMDHPGICPICHMDLQPMQTASGGAEGGIIIDPAIVQNMGVRTTMPMVGTLRQTVRAVGALTEPEQNHRAINLRVNGWIQKLYANQEGMPINEGDPLFDLYSPEITAAADELITARKATDATAHTPADAAGADPMLAQTSATVLEAARRRLGLLGLTDIQVAAIEKLDKAPATVTFVSPMHGHIAAKNVIEGSAVKAGEELMRIADKSSMWMIVQVFERDLPLVKLGAPAKVTVAAMPGKEFADAKVDFIYPHLDPSTRTAQVRIVLANADHSLHENMFGEAEIEGAGDAEKGVLVPREAIIDSGQRQLVFVDKGDGHFEPRNVTVGRSGRTADGREMTRIMTGLTEDESVVVSGQFLLDSESRMIEAQLKFLAPEIKGANDDMGGMQMGGDGGTGGSFGGVGGGGSGGGGGATGGGK